MSVREKFINALRDFEDVNLKSDAAKRALTDRIISIVQNESSDPKYWNVNVPPHVRWEESGDARLPKVLFRGKNHKNNERRR